MKHIIKHLILGSIFIFLLYFILQYIILKYREEFTQLVDVKLYNNLLIAIDTHVVNQETSWFNEEYKVKSEITIPISGVNVIFETYDFFYQDNTPYNINGNEIILIAYTPKMIKNIINTLTFINYIILDILETNNYSYSYCQFMLQNKNIPFQNYTFSSANVSIIDYNMAELLNSSNDFIANPPLSKMDIAINQINDTIKKINNPVPLGTSRSGLDLQKLNNIMNGLSNAGEKINKETADSKKVMEDHPYVYDGPELPTTPPPPPPNNTYDYIRSLSKTDQAKLPQKWFTFPANIINTGLPIEQTVTLVKQLTGHEGFVGGREGFMGMINNKNLLNYNDQAMNLIKMEIDIPNKILAIHQNTNKNFIEELFMLDEPHFIIFIIAIENALDYLNNEI
jgi:hypothetical protein